MIVGASPETDRQIIRLSAALYQRYALKRVYYSAYVPVMQDHRLPALSSPPYGEKTVFTKQIGCYVIMVFKQIELLQKGTGNFSPEYDPKTQWALENMEYFL